MGFNVGDKIQHIVSGEEFEVISIDPRSSTPNVRNPNSYSLLIEYKIRHLASGAYDTIYCQDVGMYTLSKNPISPMAFAIGDKITYIPSGEEYEIININPNVPHGWMLVTEYKLRHLASGAYTTIFDFEINKIGMYALSKNLLPLKYVANNSGAEPEHATSLGYGIPNSKNEECQHEWFTWTGLSGTITDCNKCRMVKQ